MTDKVLLIGSGGREHALAWKLAQSRHIQHIYVAPGNAGTQGDKISNIGLNVKNFDVVCDWCKENKIDLVVVGPEDPLANGIADTLGAKGIPCFGPSAKAALIEASKEFSKSFMQRHNIPTARWSAFTETSKACEYINMADHDALVVKASGLAAGKGVIVAKDKKEACDAVKSILEDKTFGSAGQTVVIEELLVGEEVSCLAFSDGTNIAVMPPAQDHKRLQDGDLGPNTGGMGAYCPYPHLSNEDLEIIQKDCLQRAVDGMKEEDREYIGVLYAGIMLTKDGPKVLEYNCRFGDPETQVLLPMMSSDLYATIMECVNGDVSSCLPKFYTDRCAVGVVKVSGGYPAAYPKGLPITGIDIVREDLKQLVFHAGTAMKDDQIVTSGGRVLAVVAMDSDLATAAKQAQLGAEAIKFKDAFHRKDIAHKAILRNQDKGIKLTYKDSGVDISAGDSFVEAIKPVAMATSRQGCVSKLGMFGGIFDCKAEGYKDPLLVSGTDGVGTKLKIANICKKHDTIGIDLVAMCVNDVLAHGAEPLFFLDYFACGKLDVATARDVVAGVGKGCQLAGCALLGGETAEMPGMYAEGDYDLAGFTVGAVERDQYLPRINDITQSDIVIGVASSGIHSNGYSLVRKVVDSCGLSYTTQCPWDETQTLGEGLLTPTRIYSKTVLPCLRSGKVKAFAHITGGGPTGNIPRVLPDNLAVEIDARKWTIPSVFGWLMTQGNIEAGEMSSTFNCGLGAVLIVSKAHVDDILTMLADNSETAYNIGTVVNKSTDAVTIHNLSTELEKCSPKANLKHKASNGLHVAAKKQRIVQKMKVGVLISGTGTNLQALIDHTTKTDSAAEIVLVVSNVPGVKGLDRAKAAGIPTKVIPHKGFKSRVEFDNAIQVELEQAEVQLVCLAGFMRILSGQFVKRWNGHLLNIHPSLLPSFKGMNAHKLVLEAGVRLTGCTVHFVAEEVDAGAILVQESVPVYPGDTIETLQERVKTAEHHAYPRALELVASGEATLKDNNKVEWTAPS
ncbi:unnamed protein product [Owenia fusiformis]|uniref:Trifunctional purine biosynthetic protein adenosine-3 n=1 Tax=Owenia fusiformis TaxID=6347 RepID=A0A8J1Y045_OWEFU|nr:unnamed protein product [Owenia fusiformis]